MKKYLSLVMAMAVLFSTMLFPMQVGAATLKSGEKATGYLDEGSNKYEIAVKDKGTLTISLDIVSEKSKLDGGISALFIKLVNENDERLEPTQARATKGSASIGYLNASLRPRDAEDKASGIFTYNVTKGTYYIILEPSARGILDYKMTFTDSSAASRSTAAPSTETKTTATLMTVALKKGAALQLGTDVAANNASKVTWKSGKSSVAKVSSTGKVTAVAKGTATITATYGKTVLKIKVVVS